MLRPARLYTGLRSGRQGWRRLAAAACWLLVTLAACARPSVTGDPYRREIEEWRQWRESRLRSEGGWLTLVGLHWLQPGENRIGIGPGFDISLPAAGGSPPQDVASPPQDVATPPGAGAGIDDSPATSRLLGTLLLDAGEVILRPDAGSSLQVNGEPLAAPRRLRSDAQEDADILGAGRLRMHLIERQGRVGLRVKDPDSPVRTEFRGILSYPVDPAWRIEADFVAYETPQLRTIPTATGIPEEMLAPGIARFRVRGRDLSLEPVLQSPEDDELFFIFQDATSGEETYGGGRFFYADPPRDGKVVLDFNKAYNPPCVFTPYATCPLPPARNILPVRVEAGEKSYVEH